jgi:hypothetical protein
MGPDGRPIHSIWISGSGRADIIVRTPWPLDHLEMEGESPIATVVTVALGAEPVTVQMAPGKVYTFNVNAKGVHGFGDYNYLLTTVSTEGFIPHLMEPANMDYRNLGAQIRFRPSFPQEHHHRSEDRVVEAHGHVRRHVRIASEIHGRGLVAAYTARRLA